jgi:hypothetical protein
MHLGSRNRLTTKSVDLFPGETLFDRFARTVCLAGCLPRKELFEAWEVAKRVHRRLHCRSGGGRIVDWACGHGVLAHALLLLDEHATGAVAFDVRLPPSSEAVHRVLVDAWPRIDRVTFTTESPALTADDIVVSVHACGTLTDDVLAHAIAARARVAVLPCCHAFGAAPLTGLEGWLDRALAIDVDRAHRLSRAGYRVWTQAIPADITPKNRLLIAEPTDR